MPPPIKELKLAHFSELSPWAEVHPHPRTGGAASRVCPPLVPDGAAAAPRPLGKGQAPPLEAPGAAGRSNLLILAMIDWELMPGFLYAV